MAAYQIQCRSCGAKLTVRSTSPVKRSTPCPKCRGPLGGEKAAAYQEDDDDETSAPQPTRRSGNSRSANSRSKQSSRAGGARGAMFWLGLGGGILAVTVVGLGIYGAIFLLTGRGASAPTAVAVNDTETSVDNTLQISASTSNNTALNNGALSANGIIRDNGSLSLPSHLMSGQPREDWISYRWLDGDKYSYDIQMKIESTQVKCSATGACNLIVTSRDRPISGELRASMEGTGTGFVVNPNGIIVTCAHVIDTASEIEVTVSGTTYKAKVLAVDDIEDVAVLQIPETGLPTLPLFDSSKVELGLEVRAVGFPITDLFGTDIKVTRGTVSGLTTDEGTARFQIDATINAGNSGGPLVNQRGDVVGVVSAKYAGVYGNTILSDVGVCVPVNAAKNLLDSLQIPLPPSQLQQDLAGPALVKAVTPAVAFIKVKGGIVGSKQTVIDSTCSLHLSTGGDTLRDILGYGSLFSSGTIRASEWGELMEVPENGEIPILMDTLPRIPFLKLPSLRQKSWTSRQEKVYARRERVRRPINSRGLLLGIYGDQEQTTLIPAEEVWNCNLVSETAEIVTIDTTYKFRTLDDSKSPRIEVEVSGLAEFSKVRGVLAKHSLRGTSTTTTPTDELKATITFETFARSKGESETQVNKWVTRTPTPGATPDPTIVAPPVVVDQPKVKIDPRVVANYELSRIGRFNRASAMTFIGNGKNIAIGSSGGEIQVIDALSGTIVHPAMSVTSSRSSN